MGTLLALYRFVEIWHHDSLSTEPSHLSAGPDTSYDFPTSKPFVRESQGRNEMARSRNSSRRSPSSTAGGYFGSAVAGYVCCLEERRLLTVGADGWTVLRTSEDSRVVYVSSSTGNDTNSGLTESTPVKTLTKAIALVRNEMPDWILLKKGDTFEPEGTWQPGYIEFAKSGRSASEPMLLSSYGSGARPVLKGTCLKAIESKSIDNMSIIGLSFQSNYLAHQMQDDPLHLGNRQAITFLGARTNTLVEDCVFSGQETSVRLASGSGFQFRRNVVYDSFGLGFYADYARDMLLEENVFDRCGWQNGIQSKFTHNVYLKEVSNVDIRGNTFSRASNFGVKLSGDKPDSASNFTIENNLFYDNGIGLDHSAGPTGDIQTTFTHQNGLVRGNVFTERVGAQALVGWLRNGEDVVWDANLFVHNWSQSIGEALMWGGHHHSITVSNNIVHDWKIEAGKNPLIHRVDEFIDGLVYEGNEIEVPANKYVDASRTLGSYYESISGTNDAVAFLTVVRDMSKDNWNTAFMADAVNDYMQAGFARVLATPVFTTPSNTTTANPLQTVSWNTVDGADGYDVWYSNLTSGQNPALKATAASASYTPATALRIGQYQIWVRATQNGGPSSSWSAPLTLRVNTAPVLNSLPADGADARPQLTWTSVPGAVRYEVWGDNLTTGAMKVVNATNVTETSFTQVSDLGFSVYRFWVRGFDAKSVTSAWSVAQDYSRVGVTTVVQPVVFDGLNSLPTITWGGIAGAVRYELWASNLTTGANAVIRNAEIPGSSFIATEPLPFGTNRFWVRAFDSNGLACKWSLPLDAVNAPALLSPVLPTFERRPTFTWAALPGVSSSEVYISINGTVINPKGLPGTSWTPASDLPVGELKWWVRPSAANGVLGPWSARAETYIGGRTTVLAAGVPGNDPARIGVFTWKAVTGASRYILQVEHVGVGTVILESNLTSTSFTTSAPLATGAYRAWIKAIDGSDKVTGIWSNAFAFTVVGVETHELNSPVVPQLAIRQMESVLSKELLASVSQLVGSDVASASQQVERSNINDKAYSNEYPFAGSWHS